MGKDFFSKDKYQVRKQRLEIKFVGLGWQIGEPSKKRSRRSRAKPRTLKTYQNKLNRFKSFYNRVYKHSLKAKEVYMALSEAEKTPKNKVFFADKYPDFDKFLAVNKLKSVGREKEERHSIFSKPTRNTGIWGIK